MAFTLKAKCDGCGYESAAFSVGSGKYVAYCPGCREIVNPKARPFLFTTPDCPACAGQLRRTDLIDYDARDEPCPRCDDGPLQFERLMHILSRGTECPVPAIGERVHTCNDKVLGPSFERKYRRNELKIPGVWGYRITLDDKLAEDVPQPVEAEVVEVGEDSIRLRFIRQLDWADL